MKRIVRFNAVENICSEGILGMNQYRLHPNEGLSPQKIICGMSCASPIFAFLKTLNINDRYSLFKLKLVQGNIGFENLLLRGLSNKLREVQYFLVLSVNITFVVIFRMAARIREIKNLAELFREAQLYLAKVSNRIKSEVLHQVVTSAKDNTAFDASPDVLPINLRYWLLTIFNQEQKVQTLLTFLNYRDCEFMCEQVVYTYEETKTAKELFEGYQVELLWEGKK